MPDLRFALVVFLPYAILLPCAILGALSSAAAQEPGAFAVEVRLGSGIGEYEPAAAGLHWSPGLALEAGIERRIRAGLAAYGALDRTAFGCKKGFCRGPEVRFVSHALELGVRGELEVPGRPWLRLGVLRQGLEARWTDDGEEASESFGASFGMGAAAGVALPVYRGFALTPGVRWVESRAEAPDGVRDRVRILVVGFGVRRGL